MRKGSFLRPGGSKKEVAEAADVGIVHGRRDSVNLWSLRFRAKLQPRFFEDAKDDIKKFGAVKNARILQSTACREQRHPGAVGQRGGTRAMGETQFFWGSCRYLAL